MSKWRLKLFLFASAGGAVLVTGVALCWPTRPPSEPAFRFLNGQEPVQEKVWQHVTRRTTRVFWTYHLTSNFEDVYATASGELRGLGFLRSTGSRPSLGACVFTRHTSGESVEVMIKERRLTADPEIMGRLTAEDTPETVTVNTEVHVSVCRMKHSIRDRLGQALSRLRKLWP